MHYIHPNLECKTVLHGTQGMIFIRPDFRGRYLAKLQKAAIEILVKKGVGRWTGRAGVRATGERQAAQFMRMGASPDGQLFSMNIGG
jgi:hypothetical protein